MAGSPSFACERARALRFALHLGAVFALLGAAGCKSWIFKHHDDGHDRDAGPTEDAGAPDAGPGPDAAMDAGPPDAGPADAGPGDAGTDAGPGEAGPGDAGADAGPGDGIDDVSFPPSDPVVTPLGMEIAGEATSSVVGPEGATLLSVDGRLVLTIPPGALTAPVTIGIATTTNEALGGIGEAYRLTPEGQTFALPVTVSLVYDEAEIEHLGTEPDALEVSFQSADGSWESPEVSVDTAARTVSAQVTHFTGVALTGRYRLVPFDAVVFTGGSLMVRAISCHAFSGDPELINCTQIAQPLQSWAVNGIAGGNASVGTVAGTGPGAAVYTAPASIPTNPLVVRVSARIRVMGRVSTMSMPVLVTDGFVYRGQVTVQGQNATGSLSSEANVTFVFSAGAMAPTLSEGVTGYARYRETRIGPVCTTRINAAGNIGATDGSLSFPAPVTYQGQGITQVQARGVTTCTGMAPSGGGALPIFVAWWPPFGSSFTVTNPDVLDDEEQVTIGGIPVTVHWHLERIFP